ARGEEMTMSTDLDAKVTALIQQICGAMGLSLSSSLEETPDNVRINLAGEGAELLLDNGGEALDALQVVVDMAFGRDARGDRHYVIDANGFRRGKDDELRRTAKEIMAKAKATGVPQEIGPLNPYARRIVHLTVAEDPSLSSDSIGDAFMKSIVISK